eukprot:2972749-Alexandrium_andersonii.AAC.1
MEMQLQIFKAALARRRGVDPSSDVGLLSSRRNAGAARSVVSLPPMQGVEPIEMRRVRVHDGRCKPHHEAVLAYIFATDWHSEGPDMKG